MDDGNNEISLWHTTAQKLIKYAGKFKYISNEFERQVGYLLLDVGVETLFRSFLTMPDSKAKLTFKKREEAAKRTVEKNDFIGEKLTLASFDEISFHKLVEAVRQVSESRFNENDLKQVEHYHNIRNKIYHLGEGIVPAKQKFDEYLQLAERLLKTLLTTSKQSEDHLIDDEAFWRDIAIKVLPYHLQKDFQEFQLNVGVAAEVFAPQTTTKRVEKGIKKIQQKIPDDDASMSDRYEMQLILQRDFVLLRDFGYYYETLPLRRFIVR